MRANLPFSRAFQGGLLCLLTLLSLNLSAQFSVQVTGTDVTCFGLSNGIATAVPSGGTSPYSFLWSTNAETMTVTNLNAGTYGVTVTDDTGATVTGSVTINQPTRVTATITEPTQCEAPFTIAAEPQGGVPPYTYNWDDDASSNTRTIVVPAGDYCVTVVDNNLCGYVACRTIEENPPNVMVVAVDALCADSNDGSLTANPGGGVPPYSYEWSNNGNTRTISNLSPGTYFLTLTDSRGCTAMGFGTVDAPLELTGEIFGDEFSCAEGGNAFIRIMPQGGTPPYQYLWSNGMTSQGIGSLGPGTYSITVTDANGCTLVDDYFIGVAPEVDIEIEGDSVLCGVGTTGTLTVVPLSGNISDYTYEWSTGATSPTITGVTPGTYSVTATSEFFCEDVATFEVIGVDLSVTVNGTNLDCFDDNSGTATATATGGGQPYTYLWATGQETATITGLSAGTYTVTVTEANGCKASGSVTITQPDPLTLTGVVNDVTCPGDDDGSIVTSVTGGSGAITYQWEDGASTANRNNLGAGEYCVTVTDGNGCTVDGCFTVTQPVPIVLTPTIRDVLCNGDATGRISVAVSGGTAPYTYEWNNDETGPVINNLTAGDYTVTVTDANDCSVVATYTVSEPPAIAITGEVESIDCFGDDNGSIDITVTGGTAPYAYRWSNNQNVPDIGGLDADDYTVTVTDANGCTATATFTVEEPTEIDIAATPTNVSCFGGSDGSIAVTVSGGTPPYSYDWDNDDDEEDLDGLTAGTYVLVVTDANGCQESITVVVAQPTAINVTGAVTDVACLGEMTGSIDLTVTGGTPGYTYLWDSGQTTADIDGLGAGEYCVTVTDANDCTAEECFTVGSNAAISITGVATPADCNGEDSGSVDISVTGGDGPYTYTWSDMTTNQDLNNVPAGTYTVTVMDSNECTATASFTVGEPDAIDLNATTPIITCGGTATGSIILNPTGGTPPYTFTIGDLTTTELVITDLPAGSYTITATDANGCIAVTDGIVLNELPQLSCEVVVVQQPTSGSNGVLRAEGDGGTLPYTYLWSNDEVTQTIDGLSSGTYSVTITDANNCTTVCTNTLRALSGIGDFVWQDDNANGQQDPGEMGIEDFPVFLKNAAGNIIDSTRTDENGRYSFLGLEPGTYSIFFDAPAGAITTLPNTGDDTTDSDADPTMNNMTGNYTLAPNEFNMTVDAGFYPEPGGAIADPCNCLNNNTNDIDGQFSEVIRITSQPGQTWVITERQNMFLFDSEDPPVAPIPVPLGTVVPEVSPGIYEYEFRLVDEFMYFSVITNGSYELTIANSCIYPTLRFNIDPPQEICRFEEAFELGGIASVPGEVIFTVNGVPATEIDPSDLPLGTILIEGVFTPTDPDECLINISQEVLIVDDCNAKLGDFVWLDINGNGIQEVNEPGIEGVKATVTSQDGTYMDMTFTDEDGMYMFSVPPGTYKVTFDPMNDDLEVSPPNQGANDELDSDVSPSTLMTPFYTVGPDEMNFTIDAGFNQPCIDNLTDPGTIGFSQEVCGPGVTPDPFVELSPATGGTGVIEYLWMLNTDDPGQPINYWQPIPGTNSPTYAPGPVSETTFFVRCVRRDDCPFIEGNVITVTVGDDAVASISGPSIVCVGQQAIFQAENVPGNAQVVWNFTGSSSVESSNQRTVTLNWATFGNFSAMLSVTAGGCTSTQTVNVSVTNNPNRCGGNLSANGTVNNLQQREVTIEWDVPSDGTIYDFAVERSSNGRDFSMIAESMEPAFLANGQAEYRTNDVSPTAGRTFYRVRMRDAEFGDLLSNVVELQLGQATTSLGRIFPNPARDGMLHIDLTTMISDESDVSAQLIDVNGQTVGTRHYGTSGTGVMNLATSNLPSGIYFVRLFVGDQMETHRVIVD